MYFFTNIIRRQREFPYFRNNVESLFRRILNDQL